MEQLHWPETIDISRHSISQVADHHRSPSMAILQTTSQKSTDINRIDESHEQTSNLLETSSTKDIEPVYDGLIALDQMRLNKMIETDLISSNC
jgi:hypothetical protein